MLDSFPLPSQTPYQRGRKTSQQTVKVSAYGLIVEGAVPPPLYPVVGGQRARPLRLVKEQRLLQDFGVVVVLAGGEPGDFFRSCLPKVGRRKTEVVESNRKLILEYFVCLGDRGSRKPEKKSRNLIQTTKAEWSILQGSCVG